MFGESYIAPESGALLNDVVAIKDSTAIFFDVNRIIKTCSSACRFHSMVVQNLFFELSRKNKKLIQKVTVGSGLKVMLLLCLSLIIRQIGILASKLLIVLLWMRRPKIESSGLLFV